MIVVHEPRSRLPFMIPNNIDEWLREFLPADEVATERNARDGTFTIRARRHVDKGYRYAETHIAAEELYTAIGGWEAVFLNHVARIVAQFDEAAVRDRVHPVFRLQRVGDRGKGSPPRTRLRR